MRAICKDIESRGWDQSSAASHLGLTRPRVAELLNAKISQFSVDALINIGVKLGIHASQCLTIVKIFAPSYPRGSVPVA